MNIIERIAKILGEDYYGDGRDWSAYSKELQNLFKKEATKVLQAILSDPSICEIEVGAELPILDALTQTVFGLTDRQQDFLNGWNSCREEVEKAGWVKKKGDGK